MQDLSADLGGTQMESALVATFSLAQTVPSDALLVTDGEISAIDSTIAAARASGHQVFVAGMGSSPAEGHLRRLAHATGGATGRIFSTRSMTAPLFSCRVCAEYITRAAPPSRWTWASCRKC